MSKTGADNTSSGLEKGIEVIRRFIARRVSSPDDVNDLVQTTFEKTLKKAQETGISNPTGYARQVARTVIIDFWRHRANTPDVLEEEPSCTASTPDMQHLSSQKVETMKRVLSNMPELRRQVFLKKRFEGLSRSEIAKALNISEESIKKHITRALIDLNEGMKNEGWEKDP